MKFNVSIGVLAGEFASQPLAYAHLFDLAPEADLDQVEVLTPPVDTRLAHFFPEARDMDLSAEETLILLLPGSGVPLQQTERLRVVGRFPGTITRALIPEE